MKYKDFPNFQNFPRTVIALIIWLVVIELYSYFYLISGFLNGASISWNDILGKALNLLAIIFLLKINRIAWFAIYLMNGILFYMHLANMAYYNLRYKEIFPEETSSYDFIAIAIPLITFIILSTSQIRAFYNINSRQIIYSHIICFTIGLGFGISMFW